MASKKINRICCLTLNHDFLEGSSFGTLIMTILDEFTDTYKKKARDLGATILFDNWCPRRCVGILP